MKSRLISYISCAVTTLWEKCFWCVSFWKKKKKKMQNEQWVPSGSAALKSSLFWCKQKISSLKLFLRKKTNSFDKASKLSWYVFYIILIYIQGAHLDYYASFALRKSKKQFEPYTNYNGFITISFLFKNDFWVRL